ncbi:hypothetical protein FKR81_18945 [Lentzea tibetensis]|uniref:Secreted protein n=1 Tax=Lentzea tibetensis TaxID=2591470 RepID=A0A563ESN9_9PSEU|nr:hypothetical protein [Lentzea tibetensis]TWP50689.1 hypothetical protein FKR81_18945 [Lentzea tibetensis]
MGGRARHRKPAVIGAGAMLVIAAAVAGFTAFGGTDSQAAESCGGLDTALQNNLNFIAGQKANPDALSEARIANRQAVVDLIQQRRAAAGCAGEVAAEDQGKAKGKDKAADKAADKADKAAGKAADKADKAADDAAAEDDAAADDAAAGDAKGGQQVCNGSTVTLSGEGGAPAASSNQFPAGTTLKVTNLDNNKSTTVKVTSVSGSCALLNNAAFEQVREPGKLLIRRAKIEKIG